MYIAGLQKMTLLDYPGRVACIVFLQGCNFCCPFCHNSGLIPGRGEEQIPWEEVLAFLKKRRGLLDGVCVTGGEPTIQRDLPELLKSVKALGYGVKLDTNGACPDMLKTVVEAGLVDYVALDIKNSPQMYTETAGMNERLLERVEESVRYLLSGKIDYEFRTTVVAEYHDPDSVKRMGQWAEKLGKGNLAKAWYLQCYTHRDSVLMPGLHAPTDAQMRQYAEILGPFAGCVSLRGVD